MKSWHRYTICVLLGLVGGGALAVHQVRSGLADNMAQSGVWKTGKSFGTKDADALTRARVALSGLLALPKTEAMYFTAREDSSGKPLDGRCTYEVKGGKLDGLWWSVTLYKGEGWLVKNAANRWSIPGHAAKQAEDGSWSFIVSPAEHPDPWLPTGNVPEFDMTLRLYHPSAAVQADPTAAIMPSIARKECGK